MLPLNDDNPTEITPVVTITFIVACVVVFFYQSSLPPRFGELFVFQYGAIPALLFGRDVVDEHVSPRQLDAFVRQYAVSVDIRQ